MSKSDPTGARSPTAEERAETPLAPYVPPVPAPSMRSILPCPPGTAQWAGDGVIECRIAGRPGESLSRRYGPAIWFHPGGAIHRVGSYEHGEWSGRWWEFDEQGRVVSSTAYVAGKEEGLSVTFHPGGRRCSECFYRAGVLEGASKRWDEDGELEAITEYRAGRPAQTTVFRAPRAASADEVAAAKDELQRLLAEQRRLLESV